ncbi:MAG: hypothetical protein JNK82_39725 [Myxococcaceae bacterium]|nr:hypothetical protein [Myxococcaceae bacterium]
MKTLVLSLVVLATAACGVTAEAPKLQLSEREQGRLNGTWSSDETSLAFAAERTADTLDFRLRNAEGVEVLTLHSVLSEQRFEINGHRVQQSGAGIIVEADVNLMPSLRARPEVAQLDALRRELAAAGVEQHLIDLVPPAEMFRADPQPDGQARQAISQCRSRCTAEFTFCYNFSLVFAPWFYAACYPIYFECLGNCPLELEPVR